jgi:hypothetical protein
VPLRLSPEVCQQYSVSVAYDSHMKRGSDEFMNLSKLETNISVVLPLDTDEAHAVMRHVHELELNNYHVVLGVPTSIFSYTKFAPYL